MIRYFWLIIILLSACTHDRDDLLTHNSLAAYTFNKSSEKGAVIACAAKAKSNDSILAFFYPVPQAKNYKIFATHSTNIDPTNYNQFIELDKDTAPVFNGYLQRFTLESNKEIFLIITVEIDNEIKISNPIKTKQKTQPTLWNNQITIDDSQSLSPVFSWQDNTTGNTAIYFQVLSDLNNNLISGTYTTEPRFQYYNLDNVVLNVTRNTPPNLIKNSNYNFMLMDVSKDNWVNLVSQIQFKAK